jgi:lipoprotein-releasing system ATP-binding protein
MLTLKNISKSFGTPGETNFRTVLSGLDFSLGEGESAAILGPSGSGKTTLLNIAGTLDFPDSGEIRFNGIDISSLSPSELDHFRNREVGFVFQQHHLLPQCTLLENILLPAMLLKDKIEKQGRKARAESLLKRVGIWDHRDKLPGKMSGGECQRAAVVRAMINSPALLLADEPTGALDSENAEILGELLLDLNKNDGLSLLLVTHSLELAGRMQKTYQLREGKLQLK